MRFMSQSSSFRLHGRRILWTCGMGCFVLLWGLPLLMILMTSFKTDREALTSTFSLPHVWSLEAYRHAWRALDYSDLLWNSVLYSFVGTALAIVLAMVPAYALSRFAFKARVLIFVVLLTPMMLPQQTVVIPLFNLFRSLGLVDTRLGLVLIHAAFGMPLELLILTGFISNIPKELEQAARIDGCTDRGVLWHIIVPLSVPAIAVGFTLNVIDIWKEYFFSLIFLSSEKVMPITLGIIRITNDRYFRTVNLPAAAVIIAQLPIIVLFIFAYRWITQGVYLGSIKS
jgi:raffinose/stachyose/melibiose transport system permease protein